MIKIHHTSAKDDFLIICCMTVLEKSSRVLQRRRFTVLKRCFSGIFPENLSEITL